MYITISVTPITRIGVTEIIFLTLLSLSKFFYLRILIAKHNYVSQKINVAGFPDPEYSYALK